MIKNYLTQNKKKLLKIKRLSEKYGQPLFYTKIFGLLLETNFIYAILRGQLRLFGQPLFYLNPSSACDYFFLFYFSFVVILYGVNRVMIVGKQVFLMEQEMLLKTPIIRIPIPVIKCCFIKNGGLTRKLIFLFSLAQNTITLLINC